MIKRERGTDVTVHHKNEGRIFSHDFLFVLVKGRNADPLAGNIFFLDIFDCKVELIDNLVNEGQEVLHEIFAVEEYMLDQILGRKFGKGLQMMIDHGIATD